MSSYPTTISNAQDFSDDEEEVAAGGQDIHSQGCISKSNPTFDGDDFAHSEARCPMDAKPSFGNLSNEAAKNIPPSMLSRNGGKRTVAFHEKTGKAFPFVRPFDKLGGKKNTSRKGGFQQSMSKSNMLNQQQSKPFQCMQDFSDEEEDSLSKIHSKIEFSDSENECEDNEGDLFELDKESFLPKSKFFSGKKKEQDRG